MKDLTEEYGLSVVYATKGIISRYVSSDTTAITKENVLRGTLT